MYDDIAILMPRSIGTLRVMMGGGSIACWQFPNDKDAALDGVRRVTVTNRYFALTHLWALRMGDVV